MEVPLETIRGKKCIDLDVEALQQQLRGYSSLVLDLGTGDGRYVCHLASQQPGWFVVGIDPCRENLRVSSRTGPSNTLFVIAAAQDLPPELRGLVSHLTINFPWGSLLDALLEAEPAVMAGIGLLCNRQASLEVRLNGGALAEAGRTLEAGTDMICDSLSRSGWQLNAPRVLGMPALRTFPTTWARRLAHGRDPHATLISGHLRAPSRAA